jgi:hypothetical protein
MSRTNTMISLSLLGALLLMSAPAGQPVFAQKKKTETKQAKPAASAPAVAKTTGATLKDFLTKYKGTKTSLGVLIRVEADYFMVDDDGVPTLYPLSEVQYIKIHLPEEGEEDPISLTISMR